MNADHIIDVIEQFADGEAVSPDALVTALATVEGREHLRGLLQLRALVAATAAVGARDAAASTPARWPAAFRVAAAAVLTIAAAAGGYVAGAGTFGTATRTASLETAERVQDAPAPTTVIKLDATTGWHDQIGGF
jgi:hypothetical protein